MKTDDQNFTCAGKEPFEKSLSVKGQGYDNLRRFNVIYRSVAYFFLFSILTEEVTPKVMCKTSVSK